MREKMKENPRDFKLISQLPPFIRERVEMWLSDAVDEKSRQKVLTIIKNSPELLIDLFGSDFAFGTAGFRALMGIGTSRLNKYTIAKAAYGVAQYFKKSKNSASIAIGYDSRNNSVEFAKVAARVLAASGIKAYVFKEVRPSPFLSFVVRYKKCAAGIMITASHNSKEYNGFELYGSDGGGITSSLEEAIVSQAQQIKGYDQIRYAEDHDPLIEWIDLQDLDEAYLKAIKVLQMSPLEDSHYGPSLRIVYTNLHGAGITLVPSALRSWGFTTLSLVEAQSTLDGEFPTIINPSPGDVNSLKLGLKQLEEMASDILIGNDCDADRIGVAVMHQGKPRILTGNEFAALCAYHVCTKLKDPLPKKGAFVISYVTTQIIKDMAHSFGIVCFEVPTGFKYISEKIYEWEQDPNGYAFLFGAEESYGCLLGTYTRNKDGIAGACIISEIALEAKRQGQTLVDMLYNIYKKYGVWREKLYSLVFTESEKGLTERKKIMDRLRLDSPSSIDGKKVMSKEDFLHGIREDFLAGTKEKVALPLSDMVIFHLDDGSKAIIRPSGTESSLRIHVASQVKADVEVQELIIQGENKASELLQAWVDELKGYLEPFAKV